MTTEQPALLEAEIPPVNDPLIVAVLAVLRSLERGDLDELQHRSTEFEAVAA